eukprot:TRINITY_DN1532_c0_g1_i14.p5 TRINITY_DN1532_c0_g1~~TRINITY_DN1532_c0_g1_i14.p5  ORF type:complete len:135 (-),score=6.08 TRINITY_DN1532_c0_g1_i14:999-1403(-)
MTCAEVSTARARRLRDKRCDTALFRVARYPYWKKEQWSIRRAFSGMALARLRAYFQQLWQRPLSPPRHEALHGAPPLTRFALGSLSLLSHAHCTHVAADGRKGGQNHVRIIGTVVEVVHQAILDAGTTQVVLAL